MGILALSALAPFALARAAPTAPVTVSDAWMRALPEKLPAGGYFTLHNGTAKTVTLSGAASPACGMLMLHQSDAMSGMARMNDVTQIDVAAGATLTFAPGGYHLMCMDPTEAVKPGGHIVVTLSFAGGARLQTVFAVRGANGK
jgi:copper(I)-binding protein